MTHRRFSRDLLEGRVFLWCPLEDSASNFS